MSNFKKVVFLNAILSLTLLFSACTSNETKLVEEQHQNEISEQKEVSQEVLYENKDKNFKLFQVEGWTKKEESISDAINIVFENGDVKAVLTILEKNKSFAEIKNELKISAGTNIQVIEESDNNISFHSNRKESIRTNIYLQENDKYTYVFTFMTFEDSYDDNKGKISAFLKNVNIN